VGSRSPATTAARTGWGDWGDWGNAKADQDNTINCFVKAVENTIDADQKPQGRQQPDVH